MSDSQDDWSEEVSPGLILGRRPLRRIVFFSVVAAAAAIAAAALWRHVMPQIERDPRYRLDASRIEVTEQPAWIPTDVKADVIRDAGLDRGLSILDGELAERIAQAFALHPWVDHVEKVRKHHPARVEVALVYRRPACMVEVPGGVYPVDAAGVVLPTTGFSAADVSRYPRVAKVTNPPIGPVGTRWGDDRIEAAARLAGFLLDDWRELQLERIVPEKSLSTGDTLLIVLTQGGSRILWGHAPGEEPSTGEATAAEKLARLKRYALRHNSLDGPQGPRNFDVRPPQDLYVNPQTASRDPAGQTQ